MQYSTDWALYRPVQLMNMLPSAHSYTVTKGNPLYGIVWEFYEFDSTDTDKGNIACLPDACSDIIFLLNEKEDENYALGSFLKMDNYQLCEKKTKVFGIRFVAGGFSKICNFPLEEFHAARIPLLSICANSNEYYDRLMNSKTFGERVQICSEFVMACISDGFEVPLLVFYTTNRILEDPCAIKIRVLAQETGYTDRYLRKVFQKYVGVSPKAFSEIARFQRSIVDFMHSPKPSMENLAMDNGFYDLAHMNKSYQNLTGTSPGHFLKNILV